MNPQSSRPLALVTGASSGIGLELARLFAQNGYDLVINSEDAAGLEAAAQSLQAEGAQVTTAMADLRTKDGVHTVLETSQSLGRPIDVLCANAGIGLGGRFTETDLETELGMIQLNVASQVHLVKHVARAMAARREGRILITGSIAGLMPGSFQSVYNGTKAFLDSWGEAIREELKEQNVVVTVLMPGATETDFFHRAEMDDTKVGQSKKMSAEDVAKVGYEALMANDDHVVAGLKNKFQALMTNILPDPALAKLHRDMAQPNSEKAAAE
jgi:short-subunit dehydrogenase